MALTQVYSANAGDTITAARWNNEWGNVYNNGTDLGFPLTKAVSFAGYTISWDATGVTTMISSATQAIQFTPGSKTGTPSTTGGVLNVVASTYTDSATAGSGTATSWAGFAIQRPTLAATNALVATTDAASLYVANSPANGTNETVTNPWAMWVDAGHARFDANVSVQGELIAGLNPWRFTATVGSNALTITLQTADGQTPSASNPVPVPFRNVTLTTPQMTTVLVTAATTLVVPSGAELGTLANVPARLYVGLQNNAGTAALTIHNSVTGVTGLFRPSESALQSSTSIGTGADSAGVMYATTGVASLAWRCLGYIEITEATPGTWATAPATVQMMGVGVHRTGDRLATAFLNLQTATFSMSSATFADITDLTLSITPTSAINAIKVQSNICFGPTTGSINSFLMVRGSTAIFAGATASNRVNVSAEMLGGNSTCLDNITIIGLDFPASASSTTYKVQIRNSSSQTVFLNRTVTDTDNSLFARGASTILLEEIFA